MTLNTVTNADTGVTTHTMALTLGEMFKRLKVPVDAEIVILPALGPMPATVCIAWQREAERASSASEKET